MTELKISVFGGEVMGALSIIVEPPIDRHETEYFDLEYTRVWECHKIYQSIYIHTVQKTKK